MTEEEAYNQWSDWYFSQEIEEEQYIAQQQEIEEFPLFFWKETCTPILNIKTGELE